MKVAIHKFDYEQIEIHLNNKTNVWILKNFWNSMWLAKCCKSPALDLGFLSLLSRPVARHELTRALLGLPWWLLGLPCPSWITFLLRFNELQAVCLHKPSQHKVYQSADFWFALVRPCSCQQPPAVGLPWSNFSFLWSAIHESMTINLPVELAKTCRTAKLLGQALFYYLISRLYTDF